MLRIFFLSLLAISTGACASLPTPEDSGKKKKLAESAVWNEAFKTRDLSKLEGILSNDFQFTSAGGKCATAAVCLDAFRSLVRKRLDLTWDNHPTDIQINENWRVAYESGDWIETWTEPDGRVEIRGKYFAMWKQRDGRWTLHAMISIPLSCIGQSSYCAPKT